MKLDLEKFAELSKTANLSRGTGKYSHIYNELDKAWNVIADLILIKKATQKTVIKLLQDAGMKELKAHNFSGWWLNTSNTLKKKVFLNNLENDKPKKPAMSGIGSMKKLDRKFE